MEDLEYGYLTSTLRRLATVEELLHALLRALAAESGGASPALRAVAEELLVQAELPGLEADLSIATAEGARDEPARKVRELLSRAGGDRTVGGTSRPSPESPLDSGPPEPSF